VVEKNEWWKRGSESDFFFQTVCDIKPTKMFTEFYLRYPDGRQDIVMNRQLPCILKSLEKAEYYRDNAGVTTDVTESSLAHEAAAFSGERDFDRDFPLAILFPSQYTMIPVPAPDEMDDLPAVDTVFHAIDAEIALDTSYAKYIIEHGMTPAEWWEKYQAEEAAQKLREARLDPETMYMSDIDAE
jgi:hypothetical protein